MTTETNIRLVQPIDRDPVRGSHLWPRFPDGRVGVRYEFRLIAEPAGCVFGLEITPDGLIHGYPTFGGVVFVPVVKATDPDGNTEKWPIHVYIANEEEDAQ